MQIVPGRTPILLVLFRYMKILLLFSGTILFLAFQSFAKDKDSTQEAKPTSSSVAHRKNQLEELFIWKLSDELRLTPDKEAAFGQLIRQINQKKFLGGQKIDDFTKAFIQSKDKLDRQKNFKSLRKAYQDYNQISIYELDEMKNLLGLEASATYLEVKQELTSKVKNLLIQGDKKENEESEAVRKNNNVILPPPKVTESPAIKK